MTKKKKINRKNPMKDDNEINDERYEIIDDGDGLPQRYELDPEAYNDNVILGYFLSRRSITQSNNKS